MMKKLITLRDLEEASIFQARAIKFYSKPKNRGRTTFSITLDERYVGQARSPKITESSVGGGSL